MRSEREQSKRSPKVNTSSFFRLVKRVFFAGGKPVSKRANRRDLLKLGDHLMDDLGFDHKGRPLQWSSFEKVDCRSEPKETVFEGCRYSKKPVCCSGKA